MRDPAPEIDGSVVSSRHSFEATNRTKLSKPGCELDAEKPWSRSSQGSGAIRRNISLRIDTVIM